MAELNKSVRPVGKAILLLDKSIILILSKQLNILFWNKYNLLYDISNNSKHLNLICLRILSAYDFL